MKTFEVKWSWLDTFLHLQKQKQMKIIDVIFSFHEVCGAEKDSNISLYGNKFKRNGGRELKVIVQNY